MIRRDITLLNNQVTPWKAHLLSPRMADLISQLDKNKDGKLDASELTGDAFEMLRQLTKNEYGLQEAETSTFESETFDVRIDNWIFNFYWGML